mgnify:CR=1 FL=1
MSTMCLPTKDCTTTAPFSPQPLFGEGVELVPVYDRAPLIERALANLRSKLLQQALIVAAICALFLLHLRSALVAILLIPLGLCFAFAVMYVQDPISKKGLLWMMML